MSSHTSPSSASAGGSARAAHTVSGGRPVVCQVLHSLNVGGGEVLAKAIALQAEEAIRPVFALLDELGILGQELKENGYTVKVLGRQPGFDIGCASRLRQFVRQESVSLIHAHQYGPLLYSAAARLPGRRVPILFTEHGRDSPDFRRPKRVWANRLLLARHDRFVAVGESVRRALVEFEGLPRERIDVIYNGCDLAAYDPRRVLREQKRSDLGLGKDDFVVMQVARLNRLKDQPTALRAMQVLAGHISDARLIFVGDGEDRSALEELTRELQLADRVSFLGSRSDVPALLQAADVFLLSSVSEGIPLTLIEAMASGLPCVATNVGGVPEVATDGETGLLAAAGDHAGLADQLLRLASEPSLRKRMGEEGRRQAVEKYSASRMYGQYLHLFREMTTGVSGTGGLNRRQGA